MTTVTEDAVYKGKALHVSEFLSTFQGFFRRNDAERRGPITVELLERALAFRQKLNDHYNLENKLAIFRKDGTLTDKQLKEMEQSVNQSKSSIESVPANVKAVHELLRRFEVWCTKSLANQVLTHCIKDKDGKVTSCCSTLLNMHGASSFLPPVGPNSGNNHALGLSAPANAWTWEEHLRLCEMVCHLQDPEEAMKSTLTVASPSLIGVRKEELRLTESHVLSPADLVALWVRAQRNTSALLHLMHLFKVTEAPEDSRGEPSDLDSDDEEDCEPPHYVAEYIGNHKLTRKHVLKCSPLVDKIVEWAVTNQALFTYKYIRENLPERLGVKKRKKRRLPVDGNIPGETTAKRRKTIRCDDEEEEDRLRRACECYVLRLFARRNRKVVSFLFTSEKKLKNMDLFPYEFLVAQLLEHNVPKKVKRFLKQDHPHNQSRTLTRLDRRIEVGSYFDGHEIDISGREAIVKLLKSLARSIPSDIVSESDILAACEDFDSLYDQFIGDKSAAESAECLLDTRVDLEEAPADALLSFAKPWEGLCSICKQSFEEEDDDIVSCDNCSKRFHSSCPGSDERSLGDLLKDDSPLAQLVPLAAELYDMPPAELEKVKIRRCAACQDLQMTLSNENRAYTEAKWCKALIRDIGMESYALPFHDENPVDKEGNNRRYISLRRLDSMMDYIIIKHDPFLAEAEREQQLKLVRSPFLVPPSTGSTATEPLEWVTESMLLNPTELLCKGVEIMMVPPRQKFDQTAFFRRFLQVFSAWFLCSREDGSDLPLHPSGNLTHMLVARTPWSVDSCIVCRSRPVETLDTSSLCVCDSAACKKVKASGDIHGKTTQPMDETFDGSLPSSVDACSSYDDLSSLVGSPLLVLPGDQMLQFVASELQTSINHMDRPMFFVVASYLPRQFAKADKLSGQLDDEGVFHVVPVLHSVQLGYLSDRLKTNMRRPPESYVDSDSWTHLDAMDMEAVVRMSADEVRQKLKETMAIRKAVDVALGNIARPARDDGNVDESVASTSQAATSISETNLVSDLVGQYSSLIDSLLSSQNSLAREMIDSLRPSSILNDDDDGEDVLNCSHIVDEFRVDVDKVERPSSRETPAGPSPRNEVNVDPTRSVAQMASAPQQVVREANLAERLPSIRNHDMEPIALNPSPRNPGDIPGGQILPPRAPEPERSFHQHAAAPAAQPHNRPPAAPSNQPFASQQEGYVAPVRGQPVNRQNDPSPVHPDQHRFERGISLRDLYQPGLTIWTRIETALYLEACRRSLPNLGLRLLCPRYSLDTSREQNSKVFGCDQTGIPKVQEALWDYMVKADYVRASSEIGDYVLEDRTSGQVFKYKLPTAILPLDRMTEAFLKREAGRSDVIDLSDGDDTTTNQLIPPRIRGGGPSDEGLFEIQPDRDEPDTQRQSVGNQGDAVAQPNGNEVAAAAQPEIINEPTALIDIPRNEWNDRLVYIRVATTIYGEDREEAVSIGCVQGMEEQGESDNVPVSLFYFSNAGYLRDGTMQYLPAAQLLIVEEGSGEYRTAQGWDGFARLPIARRVSPDEQMNGAGVFDDLNEGDEPITEAPVEDTISREAAGASRNNDKQDRLDQHTAVDPTSDGRTLLTSIPKETWANKIVFSECNTKVGDDVEEAIMIGVVRNALNVDESGEDQVLIDLIYVSTRGNLPQPIPQEISAATFYVAKEGSSEFELAMNFEGVDKLLDATKREEPIVRDDSSSRGESVAESPMELEPKDATPDPTIMKEVGTRFVTELCQRQQGPVPIGQLPDGRFTVLWAQSDPLALYIGMIAQDTPRLSNDGTREPGRTIACPWGCSTDWGRGKCSFVSEETLQEHLLARHDFGQLDDNVVAVEGVGRLFRIPEGQMICTLSAQLATAICSESPELSDFVDRSSDPETFHLNYILDLSSNERGSLRNIVVGKLQANGAARALMDLWAGIAKLFVVESTGLFRLDASDCETLLYVGTQEAPSRIVNDIDAATPLEGQGCLNGEMNGTLSDESSMCGLCGPRFHSIVRLGADDTVADEEMEASKLGGPACGLLSRLCKSSLGDFEQCTVAMGSSGPDGVARSILLTLAESIPYELRQLRTGGDSTVAAPHTSMFDDGNYQAWRYLVEHGQTAGSKFQAFVILVGSLKTAKLQRWWTGAREGWATPLAAMSSASYGYPALFLRLHALDVAIAEYLLPSRAAAEDTAPLVLRRLSSVEERIRRVHEWAKKLNYSRYEGVHESECTVCKDGGRLLVCGYCKTSQHPQCCVPVIEDDSKFDHWICPKCVTDIAVMVGEDDDDESQGK